jgi:hypothetical protein
VSIPHQPQATDRGRESDRNADCGELRVYGTDGQIRAKDTIDPANPRSSTG